MEDAGLHPEVAMTEDDLAAVIERYHAAARTFAGGDAGPIKELFSRAEDVMIANPFGPAVVGWPATSDRLDFAVSRMHDGDVSRFEELVRYASSDLVVLHETEHWRARVADRSDVEPFVLRVTTTLRREDGRWRIVQRHADPIATIDPHGPLRTG
jgi:ketosteroid isomerase-like protein